MTLTNFALSVDSDVDYRDQRISSTPTPTAMNVPGRTIQVVRPAEAIRYRVPQSPLAARFRKLAEQWSAETMDVSSVRDMILHPAYQEIIGIGPAAIPLILNELERAPNHWFAALFAVSQGQNPVSDEDAGDLEKMTEAWLEWARENGYRP